jgi:hypothetical protein
MRSARLLQLGLLVLVSQVFPASLSAQTPADNALTNADIVKMTKAGISENVIVREIQTSTTNLGTSPADLIELKKHGVSEKVLGAVVDSRGAGMEPALPNHVSGRSAPSGPHRLPSFDADLRFNSTARGKLSVRQNQIKFERAGVPLFSLKWKNPPSK